jgi:hypothetical protein
LQLVSFESIAPLILGDPALDINWIPVLRAVSPAGCVVLRPRSLREQFTAARLIGHTAAQRQGEQQNSKATHIASPNPHVIHGARNYFASGGFRSRFMVNSKFTDCRWR